jgi:GNAT superfamily N-acetyltransferase
MKLIYEHVTWSSFVEELGELLPEHYDELCVAKDFPLAPDYEAFSHLEKAGILYCITVRADGVLIGYAVFIVQPHLHYRTCLTAFEDVYFLKKEYRKGRVGIRLFQYAESVLKQFGVNRIVVGTKIHSDNSRLLEYLGYHQTDKLFTKLLKSE